MNSSKKFTAIGAISQACAKLKNQQAVLFSTLPVPILIMVVIEFFRMQSASPAISLISAAANIYLYAVIAITVHRILLIGSDAVEYPVMFPSHRIFEFILFSLAIGIVLIPVAILVFIPGIGILLFYLAAAYVVGRLSMILPSLAADDRWTFSESWRATHKYQFELFFIIGILPFISVVPELLLNGIPGAGPLLVLISCLVSIVLIASLSVAFAYIREE